MKTGAQLYTVRSYTQTEEGFAEVIKKVADIGYPGVQVSAVGPIPPRNVADICAGYGVGIVSVHTNPVRLLNETDDVIAEYREMGVSQIGIGMMPERYRKDAETVNGFIRDYIPVAHKLKNAGMTFAYHNHAFEFEKFGGRRIIERLAEGFAADEMEFILDTYWVQAGGGDPAQWLRDLAGRVPVVHFKDMELHEGAQRFCPVGEGNLNWPYIIEACRVAGVEWILVEQDDCYGRDAFDCLRSSYEFLKKAI
uniref:Xylose isomerase domain protein TIM barrel n=1 Tax=uncultured bacterium contig00025 TaxID=1181514 RepID=A0A806KJQ8_9BACT|nr:xylose isomerase domain protein TIM barrel [uncultured bacterium contig00025]